MPRPKRKAAEAADDARDPKKSKLEPKKFNLEWGTVGKELKGLHPMLALDSQTETGRTKLAGFDIDFTLIETKSGRTFATGATDWQWLYTCVPQKLRQLNKDGYRVAFFTNQAGIEKDKTKPADVMKKINAMIDELDIPVFAYVCTGTNHYRKPSTLMWDYFTKNSNSGIPLDLSKCVYVGDAAGRPKEWAPGKKKDFSCTDRMFAANTGIEFKTPEEFFLDEDPVPFEWRSIDIAQYMKSSSTLKEGQTYNKKEKEAILMVGKPASGKSTFCRKYFKPHGYEIVNRDTLKTPAKCLKVMQESLEAGQSVLVDNTNPSKSARADFIKAAKKAGASCRCFILQTTPEMAHHLNLVRQNMTNGEVRRVPDVGYAVFNKNYEEPTKAEGFSEIIKIDFVPNFEDKRHEKLFKQWTS